VPPNLSRFVPAVLQSPANVRLTANSLPLRLGTYCVFSNESHTWLIYLPWRPFEQSARWWYWSASRQPELDEPDEEGEMRDLRERGVQVLPIGAVQSGHFPNDVAAFICNLSEWERQTYATVTMYRVWEVVVYEEDAAPEWVRRLAR
jgi:hypothetical protein